MNDIQNVCVVGGAGFVGSVLVPSLIRASYRVKVLDLFIYGDNVLQPHPNLEIVRGDVRNTELLKQVFPGCDALIHLACISNDYSFELNPELSTTINYDSFGPLVDVAKDSGITRFVYASSSSIYGVKSELEVIETLKPEPLTLYSKYKAACEDVLLAKRCPGFTTVILRPATVSGYSPRFRMDVIVNVLALNALAGRRIKVLGGTQMRANLCMADMCQCYLNSLQWPAELVDGETFNVGQENFIVADLANQIRDIIGHDVEIVTEPTNDKRSYSLCSDKIRNVVGFAPKYHLEDAVKELKEAYRDGRIVNPLTNPRYYNVQWLKQIGLK